MITLLKKLSDWIVYSSANPEETSMTVQGILVGGVPVAVQHLSDLGLNVSSDSLLHAIATGCSAFALVLIVVGMVRKIVLTGQKAIQ